MNRSTILLNCKGILLDAGFTHMPDFTYRKGAYVATMDSPANSPYEYLSVKKMDGNSIEYMLAYWVISDDLGEFRANLVNTVLP